MSKVEKDMNTLGAYYTGLLYDRSLYSCYIFAKALYSQNKIGNFGWEYFLTQYHQVVDKYEKYLPQTIVYLDTPIDECIKRQKRREREMDRDGV